ncbi:hypothetical protein LY78DRAFT_706181 [Colletotrichum sublineola]|nr:hypothetical protein LY78DRAFT_706181 [Colletotrichum sublineola]
MGPTSSTNLPYHGHAESRVRRYATPCEVGPATERLGAYVPFVRHDEDPAAWVQAGEHRPALERLRATAVSRLRGRWRRDTGAVSEETRDETLRPQEAIAQEEVEGPEPGRMAGLSARRAHGVRELLADEHPGRPTKRCREGARELDIFTRQELRRKGGRADSGKNTRGELVIGSARMR